MVSSVKSSSTAGRRFHMLFVYRPLDVFAAIPCPCVLRAHNIVRNGEPRTTYSCCERVSLSSQGMNKVSVFKHAPGHRRPPLPLPPHFLPRPVSSRTVLMAVGVWTISTPTNTFLFANHEFWTRHDWSHPHDRVRVLVAALIDKNGDGVIDYEEFLPVCFSMIVEVLSDKVCVVSIGRAIMLNVDFPAHTYHSSMPGMICHLAPINLPTLKRRIH